MPKAAYAAQRNLVRVNRKSKLFNVSDEREKQRMREHYNYTMTHYSCHYDEQVSGGRVRHVHSGFRYQRGREANAWHGGLFRKILLYVVSGARAVVKEALRARINVFDNVANNGSNLKRALEYRV